MKLLRTNWQESLVRPPVADVTEPEADDGIINVFGFLDRLGSQATNELGSPPLKVRRPAPVTRPPTDRFNARHQNSLVLSCSLPRKLRR